MATILLIDDDPDLVAACELAITQHGHQVRAARSASEAREILREGPPDVVVLDVMMETKSSGFELAREVHQQYPDLPVVLLTSIHEAVPPSLRFEPDDAWLPVVTFLEKPVDPQALARQVDALLAR